MNIDAMVNSICPRCRNCDKNTVKWHDKPPVEDYSCSVPTKRYSFGKVKAQGDCVNFTPLAVLMEIECDRDSLLFIGT